MTFLPPSRAAARACDEMRQAFWPRFFSESFFDSTRSCGKIVANELTGHCRSIEPHDLLLHDFPSCPPSVEHLFGTAWQLRRARFENRSGQANDATDWVCRCSHLLEALAGGPRADRGGDGAIDCRLVSWTFGGSFLLMFARSST